MCVFLTVMSKAISKNYNNHENWLGKFESDSVIFYGYEAFIQLAEMDISVGNSLLISR